MVGIKHVVSCKYIISKNSQTILNLHVFAICALRVFGALFFIPFHLICNITPFRKGSYANLCTHVYARSCLTVRSLNVLFLNK